MSSYFKLNSSPEVKDKISGASLINNISTSTMAPLPEPVIGGGIINVSKSFKWTKTQRNNQNGYLDSNIPVIHLKEYYVTQPGFLSNIQNIYNSVSLKTAGKAVVDRVPGDSIAGGWISSVKELLGNGEQSEGWQDSAGQNATDLGNILAKTNATSKGIDTGSNSYMKSYENIYGVYPTKFKYIMPYFVGEWKSVTNSWGGEALGGKVPGIDFARNTLSKFADIASSVTAGFGMDFAKSFSYPTEGPGTSFELILDNTYDSYHDNRTVNSYQHNWELIFLLLYQNLPNRRNKLFFDPPVIYKAQVPGVLTYLYSYISSINIQSIGNRQPKDVYINTQDENGRLELKQFKTLIPEAFKVNINLKSLLPESKNLFLDSLDNKVTVTKQ
jgi:hypothetical protein